MGESPGRDQQAQMVQGAQGLFLPLPAPLAACLAVVGTGRFQVRAGEAVEDSTVTLAICLQTKGASIFFICLG